MDAQVWAVSDMSHNPFVIIRRYSVIVTDTTTVILTPASCCEIQIPDPVCSDPPANLHRLLGLGVHETPLPSRPSSAFGGRLSRTKFYKAFIANASKSLIPRVLSELIQTQEKGLGRSSILC